MSSPARSIGPYRILEELGRGAHGLVFLGQDDQSGQPVAVKTVEGLRADRLQSLRREIHTLSRVLHPGIARILGQGLQEGRPWCAIELVLGEDLGQYCRRLWAPETLSEARPRIPASALQEILTVLRRLCAPLAYLHGEGLVHRDLKPRNVLLQDAHPVLVDFGLASETEGPIARATLALGGMVGTYAYSAPEQLEGSLVDARADLYAFGSILYSLLTGRTAFETLAQVLSPDAPQPPSHHVAGLPEALDELVLGLLAKQPANRIGHAEAVAAVLAGLGARNGTPPAPRPRPYLYRPALAGRLELMSTLGRLLSQRLREGQGALVFLGGESGIGKTRLATEAAGRAQRQGLTVVLGESKPNRSGAPLQPLLDWLQIVADRCREGGPAETKRLLGPRGPALAQYQPSLLQLPGPGEPPEDLPPRQARLRLFRYLAQTLAAFADGQPLLLLLDDLQWADELTLGFLRFAAQAGLFERLPLVILGTYRAEEVSPDLQECLALAHDLRVPRLQPEAIGQLVADMLGMRQAPAPLVQSLDRHAEGNPFFVAEYLRLAVEEGLLTRDRQGRWQPRQAEGWDALPPPGAVRDLVTRRLAALPAGAQHLIRCAALLGRRVAVALLDRLALQPEEVFLEAIAEALRLQVLEDTGQSQLRFLHDQLREAAYEAIPPDQRPDLHRRAAQAIEALDPDSTAHLAELGRHWQHAGEPTRAWPCYLAAARREVARFAYAEAESLYRSALSLPHLASAESIEARRELGLNVLSMRGRKDQALQELQTALDQARDLDLPRLRAHCLHALGHVTYDLGRLEEARRFSLDALDLLRGQDTGLLEADLWTTLAAIDLLQGRLDEARQHSTEALDRRTRLGHQPGIADSLGELGVNAWHRNRLDEAAQHIEEALELNRQLGRRRQTAIHLGHLGAIRWSQGRLQDSRQLYDQALLLHREIGDRLWEGLTLGNLGATAWTEGRLDLARDLYQQALAIHREVGDRRSEGLQLTNLACVYRDQGQPQQASQLFDTGLAVHREVGNRLDEEDTLVQMAILARRTGADLTAAQKLLDQAESLATALHSPLRQARCQAERGHVLLAQDFAAHSLLAEAQRLLTEGGASPESEYGLLVARLQRAVEAHDQGLPLLRGELAEDIPAGFHAWLTQQGL